MVVLFNDSTRMIESSVWSNILLKSKKDFELIEMLAAIAPNQIKNFNEKINIQEFQILKRKQEEEFLFLLRISFSGTENDNVVDANSDIFNQVSLIPKYLKGTAQPSTKQAIFVGLFSSFGVSPIDLLV